MARRMPTNFQRLVALLKRRKKSEVADFTPPDPAIEFPHPENASLLTRLKENARPGVPRFSGGYRSTAHSDLTPILYDLIHDPAVRKGYAFGTPVMATPTGLVFAYAGGTDYIFLKLRKERFDNARRDGGWFDPTYGEDWIEFRVGGRIGSSSAWNEAMVRWAHISYQDSLSIG
jgi:hypothetical protein